MERGKTDGFVSWRVVALALVLRGICLQWLDTGQPASNL
jgi:hypothetical protein